MDYLGHIYRNFVNLVTFWMQFFFIGIEPAGADDAITTSNGRGIVLIISWHGGSAALASLSTPAHAHTS